MFTVTLRGTEFNVEFRHLQYEEPRPGPANPVRGTTQCFIKSRGHNVIAYGFALCSVEDNFCKNTGRKVSLTKALSNFPKNDRAKVWKRYFDARGRVD